MPTVTLAPAKARKHQTVSGRAKKKAAKATHAGQGLEEGSLSPITATAAISQAALTRTNATVESSGTLLGLPTSPPTVGGPKAQAAATPAVAAAVRAAMTAAQREREAEL